MVTYNVCKNSHNFCEHKIPQILKCIAKANMRVSWSVLWMLSDLVFGGLERISFEGDQLHLSYLGATSRSVSWTSITTSSPMVLTYQLKTSSISQYLPSKVTRFVEPQDESQLREGLNRYCFNWLLRLSTFFHE